MSRRHVHPSIAGAGWQSLVLGPMLLSLLIASASAQQTPAENRANGDQENVLEEFEIPKNGDLLLVPVQFADGNTYHFFINTGCPGGGIDRSLLRYMQPAPGSLDGHGKPRLYSFRGARVGTLTVGDDCVAVCQDFSKLRRLSGYDVRGYLGMDFLCSFVLHFDCDAGRLAFLKKADERLGQPVPLVFRRGCPMVEAQLGDTFVSQFYVTTGLVSFRTCGLKGATFDTLQKRVDLIPDPRSAVPETGLGSKAPRQGRIARLVIAGFEHSDVLVSEESANVMSMEYLSRYHVTLDFANGRMFLEKGARFNDEALTDSTGLRLARSGGATVVYSVEDDSPAAAAGILPANRLLEIDGRSVDSLTVFELRRMLCRSRDNVRLMLRSEGRTRECCLELNSTDGPRGPARERPHVIRATRTSTRHERLQPTPAATDDVLCEFEVARNGDDLLLPVEFEDGSTYQFLVDTGSTLVLVDTPLWEYLQPTGRTFRMSGKSGQPLYRVRDARVGSLPLSGCDIGCVDLSVPRQASGTDIRGVLGMAFLRRYVMQVDFDAGRLRFLKRGAKSLGTEVKLSYERELPFVSAQIGSMPPTEFLLDTGFVGFSACGLEKEMLDSLAERGELRPLPKLITFTAFREESQRSGVAPRLLFAGFEHRNIRVHQTSLNILGLECLSRYRVTVDFPKRRLFLEKGVRFDEAPWEDLSGLYLEQMDCPTLVTFVTRSSAAARADVAEGDRLIEVDGRAIETLTLYELHRMLGEPGRTIVLRGEHAGELCQWRLVLPERPQPGE